MCYNMKGGVKMDKVSGIYKIENILNGKIYVGQSCNVYDREKQHTCELRQGKHFNKHLQNAVNEYGIENFKFSLLEECKKADLDEREKFWIKELQSANKKYGYNNSLGGQTNRIVSDETRQLLRKSQEGEKSHSAKINECMAKKIIALLLDGKSIHKIADELKISHKIVEGIRSKRKWKHLTKNIKFPCKRSTQYKWVSRVPNTTQPLYRAVVKIDGKKIYDKCWDSAYDAAVAREMFIIDNKLNATRNFTDQDKLVIPQKTHYATSKYYGLTKEVGCNNRWVVSIHLHGKQYYVGTFGNEVEAVKAREEYINTHFPNENLKRNTLY